ncbi:MAG: Ni/Fe hydrogenase subunit alpha [Nitrospinae bacterium]|nr:Ni/Fe hydrogenase subunit alpha [Nitrospinota bacterium]
MSRVIKVDALARVEGEGGMRLRLENGKVAEAVFNIYEPPRFFEALLRGRAASEAPDITSRICGICPIAYQLSAIAAVEGVYGIAPDRRVRALRRLIYCGEWIESHALHIYFLHAPDFLGYESALHMAKDYPDVVKRALRLKKAGNSLVRVIGGREIHPINNRVGGFYRSPARGALNALYEELKWSLDAAMDTARLAAGFEFPDFTFDHELVALRHAEEYAIAEGRIVSTGGLDTTAEEYENHFEERHDPVSTALRSVIKGRGAYLAGPFARVALNFDKLTPMARQAAAETRLTPDERNPYRGIIARAVETTLAVEEAMRLIAEYEPPHPAYHDAAPRAGTGFGATEAPRGLLWHRYDIDAKGLITYAKIVPPTAQNQYAIESDLRRFAEQNAALPDNQLGWKLEQAIRNYDPCISCATHQLTVTVERS